jgi:hypothetical protein
MTLATVEGRQDVHPRNAGFAHAERPWLRSLPVALAAFFLACPVQAADQPWSATLYAGPSTTKFFTQIFVDGQYDANGATIGLALDRRLFRIGGGVTFEAEGQLTQSFGANVYTTVSAALGIRYTHVYQGRSVWSIAGYTGPSYTNNPPLSGIGFNDQHQRFRGIRLLNYVGVEFAVVLPGSNDWDGVVRFFHRSGAFGLYSIAADEGSTIGIGVRRRF